MELLPAGLLQPCWLAVNRSGIHRLSFPWQGMPADGGAEKKGAICLREMEVVIDTEEIAEFFFQELLKRGYAPVVEELEEIADITFDYLLMKCIIDEELED